MNILYAKYIADVSQDTIIQLTLAILTSTTASRQNSQWPLQQFDLHPRHLLLAFAPHARPQCNQHFGQLHSLLHHQHIRLLWLRATFHRWNQLIHLATRRLIILLWNRAVNLLPFRQAVHLWCLVGNPQPVRVADHPQGPLHRNLHGFPADCLLMHLPMHPLVPRRVNRRLILPLYPALHLQQLLPSILRACRARYRVIYLHVIPVSTLPWLPALNPL